MRTEPQAIPPETMTRRFRDWIVLRRGMAGTIVVIIVLGYMLTVSFSNTYLVQTEIKGAAAKGNNKRAFFAAFAGINYVVSQLRKDTSNTYNADYGKSKYYSDEANATRNHYCTFKVSTAGDVTYTNFLSGHSAPTPIAKKLYNSTTAFTNNTDVDPEKFRFYVSSYPGSTTAGIYWVKAQGIYRDDVADDASESKCQLWGELEIDRSGEVVILKRFGQMALQTLTYNSAAGVNDFWDWQSF